MTLLQVHLFKMCGSKDTSVWYGAVKTLHLDVQQYTHVISYAYSRDVRQYTYFTHHSDLICAGLICAGVETSASGMEFRQPKHYTDLTSNLKICSTQIRLFFSEFSLFCREIFSSGVFCVIQNNKDTALFSVGLFCYVDTMCTQCTKFFSKPIQIVKPCDMFLSDM